MTPGATPDANGTTFAAWSTTARSISVRLDGERVVPLEALGQGRFAAHVAGVAPGALYAFLLDGEVTPDPFARALPQGVHGPGCVVARERVEPLAAPLPTSSWVICEVHVGTFSPEGTFRGAEAKLAALAEIGINAIELLPIAAFDGQHGWGYDGVALYAPHAPYGSPEDLRSLVRAAHARGIAVVLDVVYNHFGPAGNYLWRYAREYFDEDVKTPWGAAPAFAHPPMRSLVVENARYWLEEFGFDGLRLDATHAIVDPSPLHVLREITDLAHALTPPRRIFFEDERNDPTVVTENGADAVWADDFHHQVHVLLTGERDGYYAAYEPSLAALALAINEGWTFTGQPFAPWKGKPRGASLRAQGVPPGKLVYCLQNHDQVGNRALGSRLAHDVDLAAFAAASTLLLFLPAIPLLLMGQEWAASSPFLFFSDHHGDLGEAIREGRREEFSAFAAFADPATRGGIPDPQSPETFQRSKLRWGERTEEPHHGMRELHRELLALRREDPVLAAPCAWADLHATARGNVLEVVRTHEDEERRLLVTFGAEPADVDVPLDARLLFTCGSYTRGELGARSAVILSLSA